MRHTPWHPRQVIIARIGIGGGDGAADARAAGGLVGVQRLRQIVLRIGDLCEGKGIFNREISALRQKRQRRMGGVTQQRDPVVVPMVRHLVPEQAPKVAGVDLRQQILQRCGAIGESRAQVGRVIIMVPAFGGPRVTLLHSDDIQPVVR